MPEQYMRVCRLSVSDPKNSARSEPSSEDNNYNLNDLHITFRVVSQTTGTLKRADFRIWNLSEHKANRIFKEFTHVRLTAGYEEASGTIFQGQIARMEMGKENAADSFLDVFAQDGDEGKNFAVTKQTLSAGWTDLDVYNQLMKDFGEYGLEAGYFDPKSLPSTTGIRAFPMAGPTSMFMSQLAYRCGCDWFVEDGKVNLLPHGVPLPLVAPVLTSASGLVGVPRLTFNGVEATCLLNPLIRVGGVVKIDNKAITQLNQPHDPRLGEDIRNVVPQLNRNGFYKAYCVVHQGDTRGNDWYTSFTGVALDAPIPMVSPAFESVSAGDG